jgi:hypothetical protein
VVLERLLRAKPVAAETRRMRGYYRQMVDVTRVKITAAGRQALSRAAAT